MLLGYWQWLVGRFYMRYLFCCQVLFRTFPPFPRLHRNPVFENEMKFVFVVYAQGHIHQTGWHFGHFACCCLQDQSLRFRLNLLESILFHCLMYRIFIGRFYYACHHIFKYLKVWRAHCLYLLELILLYRQQQKISQSQQ